MQGADVNEKDKYSRTPLHYAAMGNATETAQLLLTQGADVNAKTDQAGHRYTMRQYTTRLKRPKSC